MPIVLKNPAIFLPFYGLNFDLSFIFQISLIFKIRLDDSPVPIALIPELIPPSVPQMPTV